MPQYTRSSLRTRVNYKTKGTVPDTQMNGILNEAVRQVISDVDLASTKRMTLLSLDGANSIVSEAISGGYTSAMRTDIKEEMDKYYFHAPHDLKGNAVVDIQDRIDKESQFEMVMPDEFQRIKSYSAYKMAVDNHSFIRKLLVSGISDITKVTVHNCDTHDGDTWSVDGSQITALGTEVDNYVEGVGAINFTTVDGVMTAGTLTVSDMTAVDLSSVENHSIYMWIYVPIATGLTSIGLKWGSDASNYWSRTVTKNHDNCAFHVGWNLIRFPWSDATETGTGVETAIDYLQVTIIKGASNTGTTGWIIDGITAHKDTEHDVIYYSEYGWQDSSGVYIQESTTDTDLVNANNEEIDLIISKYAELLSDYIDDQDGVKRFNKEYLEKVFTYGAQNPSERKSTSMTYQNISSIESTSYINNDD